MFSIPNVMVREASRVYGDTVEKVAFNVTVDPASVLGSLVGGYVANRTQNALNDKRQADALQKMQEEQTLQNDYYAQTSNVLNNLKIVFTPINVIYSVNNQVFEIIRAEEMDANMRRAFLQKDANYFRDLLLKKMNMELQLAQQAFAQQLLNHEPAIKEAGYLDMQDQLLKTAAEDFSLVKTSAEYRLANMEPITITVNFDSLRPFERAADFTHATTFTKVAGIFDYFAHPDHDEVTLRDLDNQIKVGFMPDRVVFLHNGQLLEQMPLLGMNGEAYEAFRRHDHLFFQKVFHERASQMAAQIAQQAAEDGMPAGVEQQASEEAAELDKEGAALEETITHLHLFTPTRDDVHFFIDADVHPLLYEKILSDRYGADWHDHDLEAVLKQLEVDFDLTEGLSDAAINKIGAMYALTGDATSVFETPLAFEKFARALNGKAVNFTLFEGNLDLGEILFALDVAKSYCGVNVFDQFHSTLTAYFAEELQRHDIRLVSDQVYDEVNPSESAFYDSVNGYLKRKWKEDDAHGVTSQQDRDLCNRLTLMIVEITKTVLDQYADHIDMVHPYESTKVLLEDKRFLYTIDAAHRAPVGNAVVYNVAQHVIAAMFLEMKREELQWFVQKWEEEVK